MTHSSVLATKPAPIFYEVIDATPEVLSGVASRGATSKCHREGGGQEETIVRNN